MSELGTLRTAVAQVSVRLDYLEEDVRGEQLLNFHAHLAGILAFFTFSLGFVLPLAQLDGPSSPETTAWARQAGPYLPTLVLALLSTPSLASAAYRWFGRSDATTDLFILIAREVCTLALYTVLATSAAFSTAQLLHLEHGRSLFDLAWKIALLPWGGLLWLRISGERAAQAARAEAQRRRGQRWNWGYGLAENLPY